MNPSIFHIINYILNASPKLDLENSEKITKELLHIGFNSDDVNTAFYYLGFFVQTNFDFLELDVQGADFQAFTFQDNIVGSLLEKLAGLVTLFRETNIIKNKNVINFVNDIEKNINDIQNPEVIFDILDDFFNDCDHYFDSDEVFLLFPLAFRYRDIL